MQTEIERATAEREKTGVSTGAYAINPVNGKRVPIWIADYVMMSYGTGAIMGVPAHDDRDFAFALKFGLPIIPVIERNDGRAKSAVWDRLGRRTISAGALTAADLRWQPHRRSRNAAISVAVELEGEAQVAAYRDLLQRAPEAGPLGRHRGLGWQVVFRRTPSR